MHITVLQVGDMISIEKMYEDKDGAGRFYIPQELVKKLAWRHRERLVLIQDKYELRVIPEEYYLMEEKA